VVEAHAEVDDDDGLGGGLGAEVAGFAGWELCAGSAVNTAFHKRGVERGRSLKRGLEDRVEG